MNNRARIVKDVLWILALFGLVAGVFRLIFGLGATTNLTDGVPWGLWKVFNMIAGVALSTSGFTIGFLVYVLHMKRFKSFVKPAILIAFLGYGCSCLALLFDIGIPYRFWHPVFMWNFNSFLFEVFWCVLLYFTVTFIELAPTLLDGMKAKRMASVFHGVAFVAVIVGISLSSLHHSSLGSLFLVSPQRLYPLWYSPRLPLFFIISAMAGGIFFLVFVKIVWSKIYDPASVFGVKSGPETMQLSSLNGSLCCIASRSLPGPDMSKIAGLSLIGAGLLAVYLILKIIDLVVLHNLALLISGSVEGWLYILEIGIGVILPIVLIAIPGTRKSPVYAGIAAGAAAFGLVFNRLNVGIFGYAADAGQVYFPSLTEWALGIGVIAAAGLVFISLTEYLPIFNPIPAKSFTAHILASGFGSARRIWNVVLSHSLNRVSLIAVFILPLGFVLMYPPYDKNSTPPVRPSSGLDITRAVLKIDGNRRNFKTIFDHADHQKRLGDSTSCVKCHHISLPGDRSSPCYRCHRSMYDTTNIFNHESHIVSITRRDSLAGVCPSNNSCVACHQKNEPKTARSSKSCLECHREDMLPNQSEPVQPLNLEYAVSYTDAMHLTCIECHKEQKRMVNKEDLDKCQTCHQSLKKDENIVKAEIANK